jgi:hypothetical protein
MGVTVTGLNELARAIDQLPATVTQALKAEAHGTAARIVEAAKTNLRSKTHGTGKLADSIHVTEHGDEKKFTVEVPGGEGEDQLLGVYLEYGTVKMDKRRFCGRRATRKRRGTYGTWPQSPRRLSKIC